MLLKASTHPQYNQQVLEIQRKLNSIKYHVHETWPSLTTDGLFGNLTKQAVIGFQIYKNITPVSGEVGDTTLRYINEEYNKVFQLRSSVGLEKKYAIDIDWKSMASSFIAQLANVLNDISNNIIKQVKWFQQNQIESKDIDMLLRNTFEKPNVKQMREKIEKLIFDSLKEKAREGNLIYHRRKSNLEFYQINEAKRQLSIGKLNVQNQKLAEKRLAQELLDKVTTELESANFKNKISTALKNKGITQISGGGLLKAIMIAPMFWDICILIDAYINGKPTVEPLNKVFLDIISFIEGVVIGIVVGAVVGFFGAVGWIAVVIILVISIIVGIILELIFPNHSEWLANKVINCAQKLVKEFNSLLHSSVFQETAKTSFR